ncbi:MAG TPA: hypothetical protein VFE51_08205 [Verrucomicrobiae bacterium]|nr:hypothetical protein [Verrucomicrobiae bacterium]
MNAIIFCTAPGEVRALRILNELRSCGFPEAQLSVLSPEHALAGGFGPTDTPDAQPARSPDWGPAEMPVILSGLVHRTCMTRPKLGRLMGAGPLMLGLNAPSAKSEGDGFAGELANAGLPGALAAHYEQQLAAGKILISAQAANPEECLRVQAALGAARAEDIIVRAETSSHETDRRLEQYGRAA